METRDLYIIIKQRKESAEQDLIRERFRPYPSKKKEHELIGEINAYTGLIADILNDVGKEK